MADLIKRALARRRIQRGRVVIEEPNEKLVLAVKFAIGMTICLTMLEAVHMVALGAWNQEIFAVIAGLVGNITGVFLAQKA